MDTTQIVLTVIGAVLGIGGIGTFIASHIGKVGKITKTIDEVLDVVTVTTAALKDGTLSDEEKKSIAKEFHEAVKAIKDAFKK